MFDNERKRMLLLYLCIIDSDIVIDVLFQIVMQCEKRKKEGVFQSKTKDCHFLFLFKKANRFDVCLIDYD